MMIGPVFKVGGSLFTDPQLKAKLHCLLATTAGRCLLVAGGGGFADIVRQLDELHHLGESAAHEIALQSLHASAAFMRHLVGDQADVMNVPEFVRDYEARRGPLCASWSLTTDSLAALVAIEFERELVLLKSVTIPLGTEWPEAAANGWVDAEFAAIVANSRLVVQTINLLMFKAK